jgi:dihydroflavonol-4-reductase
MTTLITGGTGFLGRHLIDALIARGETNLRVLTRGFDLELSDLGVEIVEGSLTDPDDLATAVDGVTRVYHLAGRVERDPEHAHKMYELHVDGTRKLLAALKGKPVEKIVVASTSGTVGVGEAPDFLATDESPYADQIVRGWPYYLSKIYAERVCFDAIARDGLPIVLMRPTLLLGPGDRRESSTGDVVLFMRQRIPAPMPGGISFVDVRDTAEAFILAMEQAAPGSTYLLGACNLTLVDFFKRLEDITGIRAPWLPVPGKAALFGSRLLDKAHRAIGKRADVDPVSVEMAQYFWYIDSAKARQELGWKPRNPNETLKATVRWIERHHPEFAPKSARKAPPAGLVPAETLAFAEKMREKLRDETDLNS